MTAKELITSVESVCNGNLERQLDWAAMLDLGAHTSADDFEKEVSLRFKDCIVSSDHPSKIKITLV